MIKMQIVIDIPKSVYNYIMQTGSISTLDTQHIANAIFDGTSLPKGHGRIIDADYLKDVILLHNFHGNNKNIVPYADRKGYRLRDQEVKEAIINVPTIIEADKAGEEI